MSTPGWEYPHPLDGQSPKLPRARTLMELAMVKLSAALRSKPSWWKKYKEPEIRAKWKKEALETKLVWIEAATMLVPFEGHEQYMRNARQNVAIADITVGLTEKQVDYVLDELDGYAGLYDERTGTEVSCFDGIWQSDRLIPSNVKQLLLEGVQALEDVPENNKDWHPKSNEQVLDLVHPSLYPVIFGRTLAHYPNADDPLKLLQEPPYNRLSSYSSKRFQWLPTDFLVDDNGGVKALGYINNLHPSHKNLYFCVEEAIKAFVPLWERVLSDMLRELPTRITSSYLPLKKVDPKYPKKSEFKSDDDYYKALDDHEAAWNQNKIVGLPDVPKRGYPGLEKRDNLISLHGRTLQVIVKLANIHLTPEKPKYEGGSWHVEGMFTERIVASGIYYYDQQNITTSELAFRIAVQCPDGTKTGQAEGEYDYYAHLRTWGMVMDYEDSTKLNNVVGAAETRQDLCIAFPNTYQHRVSPFRLEDPTKPGHRKILALFLVDPNIKPIPSTTHVPPQQAAWQVKELLSLASSTSARKLPNEILAMIENDSGLMNDNEAKEVRLELVGERTVMLENGESDSESFLFARVFNLCEH